MSDRGAQDDVMKNALPSEVPPVAFPHARNCPARSTAQMDFGLLEARRSARTPAVPPAGSRARAQWWFSQMRQIVAEGRDFDAAGVF